MSSHKDENLENRPVIVRTYGDAPAKLMAIKFVGNAVAVRGQDGRSYLYPAADVFRFEEPLFLELTSAKKGKADVLWSKATRIAS